MGGTGRHALAGGGTGGWQLQQHAIVREGWAPNSRCGGSSPTAWSSSSGNCSEEALHPWRAGVVVRAAALKGALPACVLIPPRTLFASVGAGKGWAQ